MSEKTNRLL
jgi:hypothetical protein